MCNSKIYLDFITGIAFIFITPRYYITCFDATAKGFIFYFLSSPHNTSNTFGQSEFSGEKRWTQFLFPSHPVSNMTHLNKYVDYETLLKNNIHIPSYQTKLSICHTTLPKRHYATLSRQHTQTRHGFFFVGYPIFCEE